ncbi:MAG: G5 domain-containing protein [Ruminococcus sp.]|nr:G5 domain-containing protein [Ruminococcus sp.]
MNKTNKTRFGVLFTVMVLTLLLCIFTFSVQARTSTDDEQTGDVVYTDAILEAANINLGKNDEIIRTDRNGSTALTIVRAFDVEIMYHGESFITECTTGTVEDAIIKAGITLTGAEVVTPDLDTELTPDMSINIASPCGATLTVDGETASYTITAGTVEDFLTSVGVVLGEDDLVTPALTDAIYDGIAITVSRIVYTEETYTEEIPYGYVTEESSSLTVGTSKITQEGVNGEKTVVAKNMYVDGVLTETIIISEEVTKEPVDQITQEGTKSASSSSSSSNNSFVGSGSSISNAAGSFTDMNGNTVYYTKKLTGESTAYTAPAGALTATGVPAYLGGVAVNPDVIPYGSQLYIVGANGVVYGYATAVDTGGALMSGRVLVDVFYPTYNQCMNWGRQNATVYVLG